MVTTGQRVLCGDAMTSRRFTQATKTAARDLHLCYWMLRDSGLTHEQVELFWKLVTNHVQEVDSMAKKIRPRLNRRHSAR